MIAYNDQDHTLCFTPLTGPAVTWKVRLTVAGQQLGAEDADFEVSVDSAWRLQLRFRAIKLTWLIEAEVDASTGLLSLRSTLENKGPTAIVLGKVWPFCADSLPLSDKAVFLPGLAGQHQRSVVPVMQEDAPVCSKVKTQYFDPAGPTAIQVGFTSFLRANTEVDHRLNEGVLDVEAHADFAEWQLAPGASTPVETFTLQIGSDPHSQLERWASLAAPLINPRQWSSPPIGWLGWTWVDNYNVENYEEVVLRNCAAIDRRLSGFGFDFIWVSIGNLAGGKPGAWNSWNETNFPHGPDYLVERLREHGLKLGLWCGPFWVSSDCPEQMAELEEALLRNPDGSLLVSLEHWNYGDAALLPKADRPCLYALDPTHPKALDYIERSFAVNRERGVRYYMIDFLYAGAGNLNHPGPLAGANHAPLHNPDIVPGPEAFQMALKVIRQAAGPETYLLASTGPTLHTAGVVDGIRTGNDFGEGRAIAKESFFYPATYVINSTSFWTGCLPALRNQAAAYYTHRRLYLNDSGNVLTVDKPLPLSDALVHATIHAMSGGPSMMGDDIDRIAYERLALIKKTLPRSPDVAVPVDLFDSPLPDHPKIFHRRVAQEWGSYDVVAVYNFSSETLQLPVALSRLGLDMAADYLVWEFWDERYIGRIRDELNAVVSPGAVKVYRLVRDTGEPVLLATDMHVLMGEMEVTACQWDATTRTLSGRAVRPVGEMGSVFLHAPDNVSVANPGGHWIAKDGRDHSLIIRCALDFSEGSAEWSVSFADL